MTYATVIQDVYNEVQGLLEEISPMTYWRQMKPEQQIRKLAEMDAQQCCNTAGATLRQGNIEFADKLSARVYDSQREAMERELVRAREMGQREGREDEQQRQAQLQAELNWYRKELADATMRALKPIYIDVNMVTMEEYADVRQLNAKQAVEIRQLVEQKRAMGINAEETQRRLDNQKATIQQQRKTIEQQERTIDSILERNDNQFEIIGRMNSALAAIADVSEAIVEVADDAAIGHD